ncbi:unnamed protein product [Acanthoscelides obtectus]|uniref:C2H2-type domain-containing protein n=1 Tax=Acanthoscelides obtectus TaxID=200917 RepID=A0A9P0PUY6_ACAOB|nr:unnamed protein product [Acanthoscelides obtectus]CAK1675640.1 Zinc finger protein Gfi-1 [Acanthoscelides obtectus]
MCGMPKEFIRTKERPDVCKVCTKVLTQKSALTTHMRYHTGERPYGYVMCLKGLLPRHCSKDIIVSALLVPKNKCGF